MKDAHEALKETNKENLKTIAILKGELETLEEEKRSQHIHKLISIIMNATFKDLAILNWIGM